MKSSKRALKMKRLRIIAFDLWKQLVFKEYGEYCLQCGSPAITAHHFIPQGSCEASRYLIENGIPVCKGCHLQHHLGQPKLHAMAIEIRKKSWYHKLQKIKDQPPHILISERYLKIKIEELKCLTG